MHAYISLKIFGPKNVVQQCIEYKRFWEKGFVQFLREICGNLHLKKKSLSLMKRKNWIVFHLKNNVVNFPLNK